MFWKTSPHGPLGIIAGQGEFPLVFAKAASTIGRPVIVFGIEGLTDKRVEEFVQSVHYIPLGSLGGLLDLLKTSKVKKVVLAGGIPKREIYNPSARMDQELKGLIQTSKNGGDDHLLRSLRILLKTRLGIDVIDARSLLKDVLAPKGVLTQKAPSEGQWRDLRLGWKIAKGIGKMDIGQTVVMKQGVVLAVEALEGTNETIRRGAQLGLGNIVIVKVSKPNQDLRFDLPCVGEETLKILKETSSIALGIEAGKTIMLFKDKMLEAANREGMIIVGL
ncbi:MAG: LpxI family protein [Candidatus Omnitrophica bacterium]|nr:LpxI family protein [Candidatus Omnitrophota bacterium]